jgi:hypothetical protein
MRTRDPNIADRQRRWDEQITAQLPELLTKLLESPIYGAAPDRPKPPKAYGVYLFSERGKPCYVGRVGLTERSRRADKGFSNFRTRLNGHTLSSDTRNEDGEDADREHERLHRWSRASRSPLDYRARCRRA